MTSSYEFDFAAAKRLPPNIRFGTSSWTYPGWQGTVYKAHYKSEQDLKQNCLLEYGQFPWFRTLGIDSTFYSPPTVETLKRYSSQLPDEFLWVSKVWEQITIPAYPAHARYGTKAGKPNPDFLNPDKFAERVLGPYEKAEVLPHTGPFVFQFPMLSKDYTEQPSLFLEKLDSFMGKLPLKYAYAVEIRNPFLLQPDYFSLLNRHNVAHCFNHWSYMPPLAAQMSKAADAGGLRAPFFIARVLTPLGLAYQKAVDKFKPYQAVKAPLPEMRADVLRLAKRAIKRNVTAFVLVNNRSEGSAPQTIDSIGRMIDAELHGKPGH